MVGTHPATTETDSPKAKKHKDFRNITAPVKKLTQNSPNRGTHEAGYVAAENLLASWNLMMNKPFMRRCRNFILLIAGMMCFASHVSLADQVLSIPADSARMLTIKGVAKDIIIANPGVVDVTLQAPDRFILIGKVPGRTTLLILNADHEVLLNSIVVVSEGDGGLITVRGPRGGTMSEDSYACAGHCTLIPGSNIGGSNGGGSLGSSISPADTTATPTTPPVTKIDSTIKMKMSPNGTITGTRTDVPQYGTVQ